jgi:hypothetical protein
MVGGDQFISAVIWLTTLYRLLAIDGTGGKLVGPVHPINTCVNMVLIGSSDLEDARNPFIVRSFEATFAIVLKLLMLYS